MNIESRIQKIRRLMRKKDLSAYIINGSDPHGSEYPPLRWRTREWVSGFTGSGGVVVITNDKAALWTDFRYHIQAEKELNGIPVTLFRQGEEGVPEYDRWIRDNLSEKSRVGIDGRTIRISVLTQLKKQLEFKKIAIDPESLLIDELWENDRPEEPAGRIREFPVKYAGTPTNEKAKVIRRRMREYGADIYFASGLDDIAWLLNIRGEDVTYNPVVVSYATIEANDIIWYVDDSRLPGKVRETLTKQGIQIRPYGSLFSECMQLPPQTTVWVPQDTASVYLEKRIPTGCRRITEDDPIRSRKTIKNPIEIKGIKNAALRDGMALISFYCWLNKAVKEESLNEYLLSEKIIEFRKRDSLYRGESFPAIVGYGKNAAICHYRATKKNNSRILPGKGILLIDCGAQYETGTTDITRTISFGTPTRSQARDYTLVLKAHIALATFRFPQQTAGTRLDAIARAPLWQCGEDYGHGTGHGIGHHLNVHEGPIGITPRGRPHPIEPGMLLSNEPGLYREGKYGIRIESMILCQADKKAGFCSFQTVTRFPYEKRLIDRRYLTNNEIGWVNSYHSFLWRSMKDSLDKEEREWLRIKCMPLKEK